MWSRVLARGELDKLEGPNYAARRAELRRAAREAARARNLVCGAPAHYLESTAFGAMISVPHWTFFVVERIQESFCSGRQLHHSPLLQSAVDTQVLVLSEWLSGHGRSREV